MDDDRAKEIKKEKAMTHVFLKTKSALRVEVTKVIKSLSMEERIRQSQIVANKLLNNDIFKKSQRISVYLSTETEVDTKPIVKYILENNKTCFIPKYDYNSRNMCMLKLNSWEEYEALPLSEYNIKQPSDDDVDKYEDAMRTGGLDMIVIPGVAFTKTGDRLGHGKGYYDVYLHKYNLGFGTVPYTVGLGFKEQILENIPKLTWDYKANTVMFPM